ncbi:hypothetical protein ACFONL_18455 [Camelimonas fluminis]|uniref:Uncharacterized protein n=1 Tax=Camelimonas fluminis TaxID=1576911 RepID=A0ABV7UKT0_9HYPH
MESRRVPIWAITVTFTNSPASRPSIMQYLAGANSEDEALHAVRLRLGANPNDRKLDLVVRRSPDADGLLAIKEGQAIPFHDFERFRRAKAEMS